MQTQCSAASFGFQAVEGRSVVASFDGGTLSSDAGALLLGETDRAVASIDRFAACFTDHRDPRPIGHEVRTLVGQRVVGIAPGYEDLTAPIAWEEDREGCPQPQASPRRCPARFNRPAKRSVRSIPSPISSSPACTKQRGISGSRGSSIRRRIPAMSTESMPCLITFTGLVLP